MLHANQNERFSKRSFFAALDSVIYDLSTQTREPEGLPPDGGKTQPTPHASPPCAAVPRSPGVQGYYPWSAFDFFHDEAFDDVALFDVVVAIKADAALVARSHFLRVVLEALQAVQLAFVNHNVVA